MNAITLSGRVMVIVSIVVVGAILLSDGRREVKRRVEVNQRN